MKTASSVLAVLLVLSGTSLAQTAPAQQAVAGGESSPPEAAGQPAVPAPSPAAHTPSTEAAAASAGSVPAAASAVRFAPGAKLFLEPMDGFEQLLSEAIHKRKVPVVLVHERADADFVASGAAHVHKRGFFSGMVLSTNGKGNFWITDARAGNLVFTHKFKRADSDMTEGLIYWGWAEGCAKDMKKALEKK